MKDPGKDLPKAFAGGILIIMAIYVLVNVAYLWVLPADQLAQFSSPAVAVAEVIFVVIGILHSREISVKEYLHFCCNKFNEEKNEI